MLALDIRYSCSNINALCAAYIALTSLQPSELHDLELSIPRKSHPNSLREIDRRAVLAILAGNAFIGFSVIAGMPKYIVLGSIITIVGGGVSIAASLAQMLGYFDWAHYRRRREEREDLARLHRILAALEVPVGIGSVDEIVELAKGRRKRVELNTVQGLLITTKADSWDGYEVVLRGEERGEDVSARIKWAGKDGIKGVGDDEWMKVLNKLEKQEGQDLISLYD